MIQEERRIYVTALCCAPVATTQMLWAVEEWVNGSPLWAAIGLFNYAALAGAAVFYCLGFDKPASVQVPDPGAGGTP